MLESVLPWFNSPTCQTPMSQSHRRAMMNRSLELARGTDPDYTPVACTMLEDLIWPRRIRPCMPSGMWKRPHELRPSFVWSAI